MGKKMKIITIIPLVVTASPLYQELIDAVGILRAQIEQNYADETHALSDIESLLSSVDDGFISVTSNVLPFATTDSPLFDEPIPGGVQEINMTDYLSGNDTDLNLTEPEIPYVLNLDILNVTDNDYYIEYF